MASISKNTVYGSLVNDKGTWTVKGRICGKQKSKSTGIKDDGKASTKRKAGKVMDMILEEWEEEAKILSLNHDITFQYYVTRWLHNLDVLGEKKKAHTYRGYTNSLLLPALGNIPMTELTWRVLQDFYLELYEDNHAVSSLKKYNVVVNGAVRDARRDGVIESNPSDLVQWPKGEKFEPHPYDQGEVKKILAMTEVIGEPMRAAIMLGLCYGMRRSEVCGLRWCDIDFEAGTIHVQHTLKQYDKVILEEDSTKTQKSNRFLVLIPSTIPYFEQLHAAQKGSGLPLDKVVARPDGEVLRPDGLYSRFKTLLKNHDLDTTIRFHDLRHFAGSMLADHGVQLSQIKAFLGHDYNSPITQRVYIHEEVRSGRKTSAAMDEILKGLFAA